MGILNGCEMASSRCLVPKFDWPIVPNIGEPAIKELKEVCSAAKCPNINNWFNKLYVFRLHYNVYREAVVGKEPTDISTKLLSTQNPTDIASKLIQSKMDSFYTK